ncbi:4Fe-4S dicluster domain-containing protein [Bacteroidota bacterium]
MIEVSPDIAFIKKLQSAAGSQITTCMQCGACTASCSLSVDQDIFPRKQMIMAAWGMKDRLMADPNVWTCHQCGDCTVTCPRGVKPGEILAALRQEQIAHYSKPVFLAQWMQKPAFLPAALLFPVAIIILILSLAGTFSIPEGPVDYSKFFPHGWLNGSFTALFVLSTAGAIIGLRKFSRNVISLRSSDQTDGQSDHSSASEGHSAQSDVPEGQIPESVSPEGQISQSASLEGQNAQSASPEGQVPQKSVLLRLVSVLGRIMRHRDFNSCGEQKSRSLTHFLVFWGFILLLFVTFFAILSTIFFDYPLGFFNPIKVAGNTGAIMLFTGSTIMIINRFAKRNSLQSNYADWFFLFSFWLLTVSGILVEAARFLEWNSAYHIYFFHLVMVWIIIIYYPYTKFAHFLYRTVAMIITRSRY